MPIAKASILGYVAFQIEMIFHIVSQREWHAALRAGSYQPESLATEGFIHCSGREQVVETANLFYKGRGDLVLLCIDEKKLAAPLKFEPPASGPARTSDDFPHIHGALNLDAVVDVLEFACAGDGFFCASTRAWPLVASLKRRVTD